MNDISCESLFKVNQSQLINKIDSPMPSDTIRMPRRHELRLYQDGVSSNQQNNIEDEKDSLHCMYCKTKSISEVSNLHKNHIQSTNYLCYSCSVDLLADETVKTVLKKFGFNASSNELNSNLHKTEILQPPTKDSNDKVGFAEINVKGCLKEDMGEGKKETEEEKKEENEGSKSNIIEKCEVVEIPESQIEGLMTCSQSDEGLEEVDSNFKNKIEEILLQKENDEEKNNKTKFTPNKMSVNPLSQDPGNHLNIRVNDSVTLSQFYTEVKRIGCGRYGKVSKMIHNETNEIVAVKTIIYRNPETKRNILNEIQILNCLHGNDHILQLNEVIENNSSYPKCFHLITEYLDGGELYEQIAKDELLTEEQVIDIMCQLLNGVNFIHNKGIIHRDLKPENIVYTSKGSGHLKIIDFGFATKFDNENPPKTMVGTTVFVAPEVLRYESQSYLTDMWSVGVIAFNLLAGITPFEIPTTGDLRRQLTDMEITENIERCLYDFTDDGFIGVSDEAKHFISSLLIRDPSGRLTASQCLEHVWLTSCMYNKFRRVARSISLQRVKNYVAIRKWQKISLALQSINQFKSTIMTAAKPNA